MRSKEIEISGKKLTVHELHDICDQCTGRALTGSWVWDSAIYLSEWMASQGLVEFQIEGKTVVELGAGTGLPGLVAASLGAGRVVLTDVAPLLPGLQRSVEANGFSDRVEVRELVWGSDETWLSEVDLVLMSDVFYDTSEMPALAKTLSGLCGGGTTVWSASEVRTQTGECLELLKGEGFGVVELALVPSKAAADDLEEENLFAIFLLTPPHLLCSLDKEWSECSARP
ncbi:uncharacterized protein LOC131248633 [Magnolia sinica]|uniref:uncharacterized protein LOC131248633 n=1 Tax=Magnolia sinica TaxID=86752 RepID=UPI0026594F52|nr:uncharacterized protein LOC131248633 [Magnolia sinica]